VDDRAWGGVGHRPDVHQTQFLLAFRSSYRCPTPRPRTSGLQNILHFDVYARYNPDVGQQGVSQKSIFGRPSLMDDPLRCFLNCLKYTHNKNQFLTVFVWSNCIASRQLKLKEHYAEKHNLTKLRQSPFNKELVNKILLPYKVVAFRAAAFRTKLYITINGTPSLLFFESLLQPPFSQMIRNELFTHFKIIPRVSTALNVQVTM